MKSNVFSPRRVFEQSLMLFHKPALHIWRKHYEPSFTYVNWHLLTTNRGERVWINFYPESTAIFAVLNSWPWTTEDCGNCWPSNLQFFLNIEWKFVNESKNQHCIFTVWKRFWVHLWFCSKGMNKQVAGSWLWVENVTHSITDKPPSWHWN